MRTVRVGADPDAALRQVTLPVDWDDAAACALAVLGQGNKNCSLAQESDGWIGRLAGDTRATPHLAGRLQHLLLIRAAAPDRALWQGRTAQAGPAGFVVNLAAFVDPGAGFDRGEFTACLGTVCEALRLFASPGSTGSRLLLGNLDACLAALGLDYDSDAARDVAACLMALATATAHPGIAVRHAAGRHPPQGCVVPGLAAHVAEAWKAAVRLPDEAAGLFPESAAIETGLSAPGPVDALLGFESCGIAPVFSPLRADGRLAASTLARLAARDISPEAAFAASLAGERILPGAGFEAVQAMRRAVAPFLDWPPSQSAEPRRQPAAAPTVRRELPARHGGFTQKASIGGHKLFLRTGEYADGSLGEIAITAVRDGPAQRGLMDAFSQAVSLGLQHGVPLAAYVEAFAHTRFGPDGTVEGDASVASATSVLDYAFRSLARAYLDQTLPDAPHQEAMAPAADETLLPLDLPRAASPGTRLAIRQRHGLRLVG